jgi:hypothetical protein
VGCSWKGHPLDQLNFGVVGTITPLIDLWLEEARLPSYMQPVSRQG